MFSIEQIQQAFSRVKTGEDFPQLVQNLKSLGVSHYDNYVNDGSTNYFGTTNFMLSSSPKYPNMTIASVCSVAQLKHALLIHQQGQTDYLTFCKQAAEAGVEKWTTDMLQMTVTYFDKDENIIIKEKIPQPR